MKAMSENEKLQINKKHQANGVTFIDINTAYIESDVEIGNETVIYPNVVIEGKTVIGKNCVIGMCSTIKDSIVGDGTEIEHSVIKESEIGTDTHVGPFAYLRPNSKIGDNCKVGDFVEVKNSTFGNGSKASHLTYIGDSDIGENVNLGCGVVFVNYDGKNKHRSTIKDGAFVGCNVNLVSPVEIGEKAYIAAGSTVTSDIKGGALYVARSKGKSIDGWVEKRGLLDGKKK